MLSGPNPNDFSPSSATGWTLLVPVLGPFLSGIIAPNTAKNPYGSSQIEALIPPNNSNQLFWAGTWTIPWVLFDGLTQVAGLALIVVSYRNPDKVFIPEVLRRVQLRPYGGGTSGGLLVVGQF
jgi:hypothetical protein